MIFCTAGIAADEMQGRDRHIEFGVIGVGQHQVFALDATGFQRRHALITPNPVLEVNNRLAGVQFGEVTDQRVRINGATAVLTAARHAFPQQVAFANQRQIVEGIHKPVLGGANHQITAIIG